jgi:CHAT domain-containing protein
LHYLPFHALHDRTNYLIEQRAVSYAPSAVVFQQCLAKPTRLFEAPLLFGIADEQTPLIHEEITRVSAVFPHTRTFRDEEATVENLFRYGGEADLLHLACHAQFRPDNPLFSSLRLGDGWLTVRDAYRLKLNCSLVTLSACETGVNAVAPGEELIGMARGFLSAGSPSVLLSLWTVDDEATAQLMAEFYGQVPHTNSYSEALRAAQTNLLKEKPHPFFWSPFVLVGHP